ncbi:MAG: hypothetical protein HRT80_16190 [Henriciella sp.]|nr:hypothetical protein [Henriciella sp.]
MRQLFRLLYRRGIVLSAAFAAMTASPAMADWQMTVTVEDGSGPHAFCLTSAETASVLSGFVSRSRSVSLLVPNDRFAGKSSALSVTVTGKQGSVVLRADPSNTDVTADMGQARKSESACNLDNVIPVDEATEAMMAGLREKAESSEVANAISDPKSVMAYLESQSETMKVAYRDSQVTGLIRSDSYNAVVEQIAKDQKAREDRRKANEMLERVMAAVAMLAEEKKAAKEREEAANRRKQDEARTAFREADAESARNSGDDTPNVTDGPYKGENCFGAVGEGCAPMSWSWEKLFPEGSSCSPTMRNNPYIVECLVNTGSWAHDECCVRNPQGKKCGQQDREPNKCSAEWDHAFNHTLGGLYTWKRTVSKQVYNSSGYINEPLYCAPKGQALALGEGTEFCCSGRAKNEMVFYWAAFFLVDICQS